MTDRYITEQIKRAALSTGMDLVGFAPVERWRNAPFLLSPAAILPGSRSVVVCGLSLSDTWTEMGGEPDPQVLGPGGWIDHNSLLDRAAYKIARLIESLGYRAIPIASSNIWRFRHFEGVNSTFTPDLSHIHAATAAGLAQIGWSGLAITPEYGPRIRFISVVTDAIFAYTPMYDGPELCDMCMACVKACPSAALRKDLGKNPRVVDIEGKIFKYADKNIWRCAWAEHFSLDLDSSRLGKPHIDEQEITTALDNDEFRGHERGVCQKVCIPPHLRTTVPSFGRDGKHIASARVNRKYLDSMPTLRKLRDDVIARGLDMGADIASAALLDPDSATGQAVLQEAPGMQGIIAFGLRVPIETKDQARLNNYTFAPYNYASYFKMHHILIRLVNFLEECGYKTAAYTGPLPDVNGPDLALALQDLTTDPQNQDHKMLALAQAQPVDRNKLDHKMLALSLAQQAGLGAITGNLFKTAEFGPDVLVGALLTEANVDPSPVSSPYRPVSPPDQVSVGFDLRAELTELARSNQVDLFGIAAADTFTDTVTDLKQHIDQEGLGHGVVDECDRLHGVWKSRIIKENVLIRSPGDYLQQARSVIVLGMHLPQQLIANSGEAETKQIGTYGYYTYQTVLELRFAALALANRLNVLGYRTMITENMLGLGSRMDSPRGELPDMRCNALEGAAVGFGVIGRSGALLHPVYGPHQRRIVIITDAELPVTELPADQLQSVQNACQDCILCLKACPMAAIADDSIPVRLNGQQIRVPAIHRNRCDWAKRYSLNKAEGPELIGATTHVELDSSISEPTIEMLAAGCECKDIIMKKRTVILEPCLKVCPVGRML